MKINLVLFLAMMFSGVVHADLYGDRARASWAQQLKVEEQQSREKYLQHNQELRLKIYQWTYGFTNNSPEAAQKADCSVAPIACHNGGCWAGFDRDTMKLDQTVTRPMYVSQCSVYLPAPHDLACRVSRTRDLNVPKDSPPKWNTYARCLDKSARAQDFSL